MMTEIIVAQSAFENITGLCGNFDGVTTNDFNGQDGKHLTSLADAALSWADVNMCSGTDPDPTNSCTEVR